MHRFPHFIATITIAASLSLADSRTEEDRRMFADGLFSREYFAAAATEYKLLLDNFPNIADADAVTFRLAESLRLAGKLKDAGAAFIAVSKMKNSPYWQKAAFKHAALFLDPSLPATTININNAVLCFELLLKEPNLEPEIHELALYYNSEALLQAGKKAEACESLDTLVTKFPKGDMASISKLSLGRILADSEAEADLARSEKLLREVADDKSATQRLAAEALYMLFRAKFAANDNKAAAKIFDELKMRFPDDVRVAESRLQSAWAYLKAGLSDAAIEICKEALDGAVNRPGEQKTEFQYILATSYFQVLQYDEALKNYLQITANPASPFATKSWYQIALCEFRSGAFNSAIDALRRIINDKELREDVLWLMAESAAGNHDAALAIQNYRLLITEFPDTKFGADPYYRLGHQLQLNKQWLEAANFYGKLTEVFPDSPLVPKALFASATSLSLAGQGASALRDWEEYLKRFPNDEGAPEALYQKALEEIRQERKTEALSTLDTLATRFPDTVRFPDAQFWRGHLLLEKKSLDDAERAFRTTLASNPSHDITRESKFALAQTLLQLDRNADAAAILQELVNDPIRSKFTPQQFAWLSEHQFGAKDYATAAKTARAFAAQTEEPRWKQVAWVLAGRAHRALNDNAEAKKAFAAAAAIDVRTLHLAEAQLRLGDIALEEKKSAEAEEFFKRTISLASSSDPSNIGYRIHAYDKLGDIALAKNTPDGKDSAARYYMMLAMMYTNPDIPPVFAKLIPLLESLNRTKEADDMRRELAKHYPDSEESKNFPPAGELPVAVINE